MNKVIQGTKSFSRNIDILQLIADAPRPPSLTDIIDPSELTRPTLYRVLAALEAELLVVQLPDKRYSLGPRLISLAKNALANNDIRKIARTDLERLGDKTGETVHLAIPSGTQMMIMDKIESREVVRMASVIGMLVPFHTTGVGKAFLVGLKPQKLADLINRLPLEQITSFTTTDPDRLQEKIVNAQKDGFIIDDQEILITSANLTFTAMNENIETGVWSKDKKIINACIEIFDKFIEEQTFVPKLEKKY